MRYFLTDPTSHKVGGVVANIGDEIIKEAISLALQSCMDYSRWVDIDKADISLKDSVIILAGANILSNRPFLNKNVWRPRLLDYVHSNFVVLFGVGWWQYQKQTDIFTKKFYQRFLMRDNVFHSVRDSYTESKLRNCGITNVLNTNCPTMWALNSQYNFPTGPAKKVIITLTDYAKQPECDRFLIDFVLRSYEEVYFFPQGVGDVEYLSLLSSKDGLNKIIKINPSLESYDRVLESENVDYIGTRLHGGIRALQKGRRPLIIAVDNRAQEIAKDTGITVVSREKIQTILPALVDSVDNINVNLNKENISLYLESLIRFLTNN